MLYTSEYCNDGYKDSLYFEGMNTISDRIALARKAKDLNQSELARMLKVSPQAVQSWESGKSQPRGPRIEALAHALGISVQFLMTGVEPTQGQPIKHVPYGDLFNGETETEKSRARLKVVTDFAEEMETRIGQLNNSLRESLANLDILRRIDDPTLLISIFYITAAAAENGLTPLEREQLTRIANRIKHQPIGMLEVE
ncbi:helix-turn-helix protein [compost metagenome]